VLVVWTVLTADDRPKVAVLKVTLWIAAGSSVRTHQTPYSIGIKKEEAEDKKIFLYLV
jgi:hypothetical protein